MSEAPVRDPLLGAVVAGRYHVERRLAQGGMGVVYVARQEPLGRRVALKVIRGDANDPVAQQRFEREARAAASLQDPHVVVVHDFGVIDGVAGGLFLAMELLEGETLRHRLGGAPLSWGQSVGLVHQVAQALAAAHARGVVHRDLKPENIMLGKSDGGTERCKVLDFGLAKGTGAAVLIDSGKNLTHSGGFVGTPGYISPETLDGAPEDPRQDVYALGIIWWELLSGRHPFPAETPMKTLVRQLHEDPPPLDPALRETAGVPDDGAALLLELMARDPARRPRDGAAVLARIAGLRDGPALVGATPRLIDSNAETIAGVRSSVSRASQPTAQAPSPLSAQAVSPPTAEQDREALTVEARRRPALAPEASPPPAASVAVATTSAPIRRRRLKLRQRLFVALLVTSVIGTVTGVVVLRALETTPLAAGDGDGDETLAPQAPLVIAATEVIFEGVPGLLGLRQLRDRLPPHILRLYRTGHAELVLSGDVGGDVADRLQGVEITLPGPEPTDPFRRFVVEVDEILGGRVAVTVRPAVDEVIEPVVFDDAGVADVPGGLDP